MKTAEKNAKIAQGANNQNSSKNNIRPSLTGKEAKNDKDNKDAPQKGEETETAKATGAEAGAATAMADQSANIAEPANDELNKVDDKGAAPKHKTEVQQPEANEAKPALPELTLDAKLKAISDLNRKSVQRLALIARMKQLEDFEVALLANSDELESNPYQACKLIIRDDKNREFATVTPGLIRLVSQFIFNACSEKLEEIEATIVFPQTV